MYLLDTQALTELASGQEGPLADRVRLAERQNRDVRTSVVSIGSLRAAILALTAASERDTWQKRLNELLRLLSDRSAIVDVDRRAADEYALLKGMDLQDADGADIGEAERLVVATAMAEGYTLITQTPDNYKAARAQGRLLVEAV